MNLNRRSILFWTIALLAADLTLTWLSYRAGSLRYGRSPLLDVWDLTKALAVGLVLTITARRVGSRGLTVLGIASVLVGMVGSTHLHGVLADLILPGLGTGMGKFLLLVTAVVVVVVVLFRIRDSWPHYPRVRSVAVLLLFTLLFVAGFLDLLGAFRGASLLEESVERLVMSVALACSLVLLKSVVDTPVRNETY